MIKIKYCGRMGNSLLQYAFARILSKELNQYLPPHPIMGFPNTYKDINSNMKSDEKDPWLTLTKRNLWNIEEIRKQMILNKNIFIKSSCANSKNFKNYKNEIKNDWFCIVQPFDKNNLNLNNHFFTWNNSLSPIKICDIKDDDVIVHVRLDDIVSGRHAHNKLLTFDYFDIILKNIKINRLFITSDSPQHPLLRPFDKYSPIFFNGNTMETFNLMRIFNRIVLSQSSYSWWAAYLSDATEIYYPIAIKGSWAISPQNDEDYRIEEDRYIYVSERKMKIIGKFDEVKEWI
jgi:hypothetical protein